MTTKPKSQKPSKAKEKTAPRRRLQPDNREKIIVDEAIKFFAEVGFEGRTRDLALRLNVTQPLLYRYFPNKESLIERVYQEVYLGRLKPEWSSLIMDRSLPLSERLLTFYTQYQKTVSNYEWVRIFMFSGLRGVGINERYLAVLEERILRPICLELRAEHGFPDTIETPISAEEIEFVWSLHGQFFYRAVRKWIYNLPVPEDLTEILNYDIKCYLENAPKFLQTKFSNK